MRQQAQRITTPDTAAQMPSNVYETPGGEAYVIEVPVPGLKPDEILIEVTVGSVTVSTRPGKEGEEGRRYLQRERLIEPMSRVFEFGMDIDTDNVRAALENGMLRIQVPKALAARRRVIRVA